MVCPTNIHASYLETITGYNQKGPTVISQKISLKSGSRAYQQLKLQYNFQSKAAPWSLDHTCYMCANRLNVPEMFSSAVANQCCSIHDIAVCRRQLCTYCFMIVVPGLCELQNCTWELFGKVLTGPGQIMPGIVLAIYWCSQSSLSAQECILALLNLLVQTQPLVPRALNK